MPYSNPHRKFEISNCSRSTDKEGILKLKAWLGQIWSYFAFRRQNSRHSHI